jgi:hypothetical protein
MIKKFEQFVVSLNESHESDKYSQYTLDDGSADKRGNEYLVQNSSLVVGTNDDKMVRSYIRQQTGMNPPEDMTNLGELVVFCIRHYKPFVEEEKFVPTEIKNLKLFIKSFFANTEIEQDYSKAFTHGVDAVDNAWIVSATFKNFANISGVKGILDLYLELFKYLKDRIQTNKEALDGEARRRISEIIQQVKTVWDPKGWDAFDWMFFTGDSDAIIELNKNLLDVFGKYVRAKAKYLEGGSTKAAQTPAPAAQTPAPAAQASTDSTKKETPSQTAPVTGAQTTKPQTRTPASTPTRTKRISIR